MLQSKDPTLKGGVKALSEWLHPIWEKEWKMRTAVRDIMEHCDFSSSFLLDAEGSVSYPTLYRCSAADCNSLRS